MKKVALITGASSGIGMELARVHASKGNNLVLVARRKSKLDELKKELEHQFKISVYVIAKDLSEQNSAQDVYDELKQQDIQIEYLVNNAGFGDYGMFYEADWVKESHMINLNIFTLTNFCKLFLKDMVANGSGKIMNVASTAAFQPGPSMAVYFATKAYVLSFSEAIGNEVLDMGITVTALCPGATESGFMAAASLEKSKLFKGKNIATSKEVAEFGYAAMMKGKAVAVHGILNSFLTNMIKFAPRSLVVKVTRKMLDKVK
jgi:short-subunit dehydrogenase